jgi:hypothetical protein
MNCLCHLIVPGHTKALRAVALAKHQQIMDEHRRAINAAYDSCQEYVNECRRIDSLEQRINDIVSGGVQHPAEITAAIMKLITPTTPNPRGAA